VNPIIRSYGELVRVPNVLTAVADIAAGFLYVGCGTKDGAALVWLACASACMYSGGMALNDACDVVRDQCERPGRPIPSGRVSRSAAHRLSALLLLLGPILAAGASIASALVATLLVVVIILYDAVLKSTALAPGLMGLCRALNLVLGMSAAPLALTAVAIVPCVLMWLYVASVTVFARFEARQSSRTRLGIGLLGIGAAVTGLATLPLIHGSGPRDYLAGVVALFFFVAATGWRAIQDPQLTAMQRAVKTFVIGIIVFDAALVWATRDELAALGVAALILPALVLARTFRVT